MMSRIANLLLLFHFSASCFALTWNSTTDLVAVVAPYDQKTFWVDKSCTDRVDKNGNRIWDGLLRDTFAMACAAKKSLAPDAVDSDFERVFRMLFNIEVTDKKMFPMPLNYQLRFRDQMHKTAKNMVLDIMTDTCDNWLQIPSGDQSSPDKVKQAHLRIYCDNAMASEGKRLRKLPNGRISDVDNAMIDHGDCSPFERVEDGYKETAEMDAFVHTKTIARGSHNPDRAVMTICDAAFKNDVVLNDIQPHNDWQSFKGPDDRLMKVTVGPFRTLTAFTMLHEWMHVYPYLLHDMRERMDDGHVDPDSAYTWKNCIRKMPDEGLWNAETLAYLGLLATFARLTQQHAETSAITGGYTLRRQPEDMTDRKVFAGYVDSLASGQLFFYHDITTPGNPGGPNAHG